MISVSVETVASDWKEFQSDWMSNATSNTSVSWRPIVIGIFFGAAVAFVYIEFRPTLHWPTALAVAILSLALIATFLRVFARAMKAAIPREDGIFLGQHTYRFASDGIFTSGMNCRCEYRWALVNSVRETKNLIIIMVDSAAAVIVPKRDIADAAGLLKFIEENRASERQE
jgi:YcxB-like protein